MNDEHDPHTADARRRHFLARSSALSIGMLALPLAACGDGLSTDARAAEAAEVPIAAGTGFTIDDSIPSPNRDSRVRSLVLHYTAESLAESLASLTDPQKQVSAHYLVPDAPDGGTVFRVFRLVPESQRAWHAGVSAWQSDRMLNASSVGIEIVNPGFPPADDALPPMSRRWVRYPDAQVAVFGALAADVVERHQILPHRVVGHSDVAPGRKFDPGPLFPWQRLYERHGVGAWPDADAVAYYRANRPYRGDVGELQSKLAAYGYDAPQTGQLDAKTLDVVSAFQMHFRPARYDGVPDVETAAILDALLEKYFRRGRAQYRQAAPLPTDRDEKDGDAWGAPAAR